MSEEPEWPRHSGTMTITHNEHLCMYQTIAQAFATGGVYEQYRVFEEDKAVCISTGSVWIIQWNPDTPVGSYTVVAPTFLDAVKAAVIVQKIVDSGILP